VADKKVIRKHTRRIWPIYSILLTVPLLFATDQSVANKAWAVLEAGLHDKKTENRIQAVLALGLIPSNKKAIDAAERALDDPNANVCRAAITALADMGAKGSLPKIKALLNRSDAKTVVTIAAALNKFKDPEAYEIYYEVLTGKRKGGGSIVDGIKDKKALEKMGVESAIGIAPFGGVATGAYGYFKQNGSAQSNLDVTAVNALEQDPDQRVEKTLIDVSFNDKEPVQVAALHALAKRGDPSAVQAIEPAMYSDKAVIRYAAAATIVHLLDPRPKQRA
jgi:HEAT repeat protein